MGCCNKCLMRIPYASLVATILCVVGVAIYISSMQRAITLTVTMLMEVFHFQVTDWWDNLYLCITILGGVMVAIGLVTLFIGFLATGATRERTYRAWRSRVTGRISCAVFMCLSYAMLLLWVLSLVFSVALLLFTTVSYYLCTSPRVKVEHRCIDFTQFDVIFHLFTKPNQFQEKFMICEPNDIKGFCKDYVEKAQIMYFLSAFSCLLILLSVVHYLMCLAANYAHIRDHSKLQELQELQYLAAESDNILHSSKDRF